MTSRRPSPSRRRYLRTVGAALGTIGFAGCSSVRDGTTGNDRDPTATPATPRTDPAITTGSRATSTADSTATPIHAGYETTQVRVLTAGGDTVDTVTAAIADTPDLRYLGLSNTESLPEDRGMLFVYEGVEDHTFVMREMDFGIDIVYADEEGTITRIHHAPAPGPNEDGSEQTYPGRGQYVLELTYEWTTEREITAGDVLDFDL